MVGAVGSRTYHPVIKSQILLNLSTRGHFRSRISPIQPSADTISAQDRAVSSDFKGHFRLLLCQILVFVLVLAKIALPCSLSTNLPTFSTSAQPHKRTIRSPLPRSPKGQKQACNFRRMVALALHPCLHASRMVLLHMSVTSGAVRAGEREALAKASSRRSLPPWPTRSRRVAALLKA